MSAEKPLDRVRQNVLLARSGQIPACPFTAGSYGPNRFMDIWEDKGKEERLAPLADFVDRFTTKALDLRPSRFPFGLVDRKKPGSELRIVKAIPARKPFDFLLEAMTTTLVATSYDVWGELRDKYESDPLSPEGILHKQLTDWENAAKIVNPDFNYMSMMMERSVRIGVTYLVSLLKVAPEAYAIKHGVRPSPDQALNVADRGYSSLESIALLDEDHENRVADAIKLKVPPRFFDPNAFEIQGEGDTERVQPKKEKILEGYGSYTDPREFGGARKRQVGCVATIDFGMGNSVHRLWDWHMDIARLAGDKFYPQRAFLGAVALDEVLRLIHRG